MDDIRTLLVLIPGLPLAAALVTAVLGPKLLKGQSHVPTVLALVGSFLCSLVLFGNTQFAHSRLASQSSEMVGYEFSPVTLWRWANIEGALPPQADAVGGVISPTTAYDFAVDITLRADALTAIMLLMVTFVATLVAVYASSYMHGDRGYWRFFTYVSLFVFSMTMLVSVSNFVLLYVFWEAVGVCSYLLIGFWYEKPDAAAAGKKAFLVNRVGDFGFALALFLIWTTYGTLNFHDTPSAGGETTVAGVLGQARESGSVPYATGGVATAICLLLLLGACGKSAQFPLHVWLPDAMEGPTPVSALIHAATMVTAGIYLVARCMPLFHTSPMALVVVSIIGGFTAILAALIALTQFDLKRVLAYSTVSQLGFMFLALGTGSFTGTTAGMFHLFSHAFFKALLFLGAGSVMHAMGGVIDMRRFGGLRHKMPVTCITFLVGCLALAGMPPLAGFFSKDAVLEAVEHRAHTLKHELEADGQEDRDHAAAHAEPPARVVLATTELSHAEMAWHYRAYNTLYYMALVTAFLTAFYTFRAFFLTFGGEERIPAEAGHHAHESPAAMTVPLMVLAVCSVVVGWFERPFVEFLWNSPSIAWAVPEHAAEQLEFPWMIAAVSTFCCFLPGVGLAAYLYLGSAREITWLAGFMRFQWLAQLADLAWLEQLRRTTLVSGAERGLRRLGLGGICNFVGGLVQLLAVIFLAPVLVARFLSPIRLSQNKFYFDELYQFTIVWPLALLARFCYWCDRWLVDGLVNFCGRVPVVAGGLMRSLQMGLVQFYALAMVLGVLLLIALKMVYLT